MTAQEYIYSELQKLAEPVSIENTGTTPIEDAIFAKVMSKKFRKLKADALAVAITEKAIKLAVADNKPITVSYLFGGYKLWRFDEAPEIDWAELFSIIYFLSWMKSIASVYEPGARLDFYSEDVAVESLNNVPRNETDKYSETFRAILDWLKPYVPNGVTVTYRRYGEEYENYSDYLRELKEAKELFLEKNNGKLPVLNENQKAATDLNVKLLPGQADDPRWLEKVELIHQCMEQTKTLKRYLDDPLLIRACPTWYSGYIATGSTKKSYAKFWAAVGALEKSDDSFNELVLTPNQLAKANFEWEDLNIEGLDGKNFKKIRIVKT